jgi:hypothetical protein
MERVEILYGRQLTQPTPLDRMTYNVFRNRENSLTTSPKTGLRSTSRILYKNAYDLWHRKIRHLRATLSPDFASVIHPYMNFPASGKRAFEVPDPENILLSNNDSTRSFKEIFRSDPELSPPKISIIMQSFLGEYPYARSEPEKKFIRAVYSVISQTNTNWELIIISDGCLITERLYNEYFKEYKNIFFKRIDKPKETLMYSAENGGSLSRCAPRAHGVDMASGDWVCYIDADDFFTKDAVEKITNLVKNAESQPNDIRYLLNIARLENQALEVSRPLFIEDSALCIEGLPSSWKKVSITGKGSVITGTSQIIHKKGYPKHRWGDSDEPGHVGGDNVFVGKIIHDTESIAFCELVDSAYYVRCHLKQEWDH